jgi:hypothetical protein
MKVFVELNLMSSPQNIDLSLITSTAKGGTLCYRIIATGIPRIGVSLAL